MDTDFELVRHQDNQEFRRVRYMGFTSLPRHSTARFDDNWLLCMETNPTVQTLGANRNDRIKGDQLNEVPTS